MRARWLALFCGLSIVFAPTVVKSPAATAFAEGRSVGAAPAGPLEGSEETARALSKATGLAISPLLVLAGEGAVQFYRASPDDLESLPWNARRAFWIPALVLILLVFLKEVILGRFIALKKPLDMLQLVGNTISGILACPLAVSALASLLEPRLAGAIAWSGELLLPVAYAASPAAGATTSVVGTLAWVAAIVGGFVFFVSLWMASNAVNVLLLLCPFGFVDNLVRLSRLLLLGIGLALVIFVPTVGIIVCLMLMAVALWLSGWSFRLMVFGAVFSLDVLFHRQPDPADSGLRVFATGGLPAVPARTYGRLRRGPLGLELTYRPWLVLGKRTFRTSPEHVEIGAALVSPVILRIKDPGKYETLEQLFRLPPRYRGREAEVAAALGGLRVRDTPLVQGFKALRNWFDAVVNEGTIPTGL
jgi:hypothetical protein